jgi:hypothetical protein
MTRKPRVAAAGKPAAARPLWAYGYEMVAPHPAGCMAEIRGVLDRQNAEAARAGRTWAARLVTTRLVHVLIVSGSPELDLDVNCELEAELAGLGVRYLVTLPMQVSDTAEADAET